MWLDREGTFRAFPIGQGLYEAKDSQAIAVDIRFQIAEQHEDGQWIDWAQYEPMECSGRFWVIKKDGSINTRQVETLKNVLGWTGSMSELLNEDWSSKGVQIVVKPDTYNGQTRFKATWLNDWDAEPFSQIGNVDADKAKQLDGRFASQFRAIGGGANRGTPAPPGRPLSPARPPARSQPARAAAGADVGEPSLQGEDIPF